MKRLVVTDEARRDLRQIERFTQRNWGPEQASAYQEALIKSFARLMLRPDRGHPEPALYPGMRRLNVRSHAIFFFVEGDDLIIARLLHQSMDITATMFRKA